MFNVVSWERSCKVIQSSKKICFQSVSLREAAVQFSCVWLFVTPMNCSTPGFPVLHYLPEFAQIHIHWVGDAITISSSAVLFSLPSIFPSTWVFSNELAHHIWWPKYWSFSFSISSSNKYSGLYFIKIKNCGDIPGGPVAKTSHSQCRGPEIQLLVRKLKDLCHN